MTTSEKTKELYDVSKKMMPFVFKLTNNYIDAEDLIQDSLIKAIRYIDSYEPNKSKMSTWFSVIVKNLFIDTTRKKKIDVINDIDMGNDSIEEKYNNIIVSKNCALDNLYYIDIQNIIESNIKNPRDVRILSMKSNGYTDIEISKEMNIGTGVVKHSLHRIKKKLSKKIKKY